jgi:asparagine synthase (glutamine-hydrolysing)
MCGIAGIVSQDPARRQRIGPMLDAMVHRGPDDEGRVDSAPAVLGQRRLSIIDLAGGHQPIPNADETAWIICNGEIYNYQALRDELVAEGVRFRCHSDTEVILHLYEKHGIDCVHRLRGMFAFAIWDARRKLLFCARDRLGQKPFYYWTSGGEFAFGSEIKALLAMDSGLRSLNRAALDQYLGLRIISSPDSMFSGVCKLPPAHLLTFSPEQGLNIRQYWDLSFEPKHEQDESVLLDELESRLIDTLRLHMVSDVPVGAFMSGGLDSTLVVAMLMKHVCKEPLQTFTMGLPYREFDETPAARRVAEAYGTQHHEQVITPSLVRNLPELVWHLDEPSDPLSVCAYLLAEFAARKVKVVLGGDGGDELFGGYDRYYGNQYAGLLARVPAVMRRGLLGTVLRVLPDGGWYKSRAHQLKWLYELSFLSGSQRYARSLGYFYFGDDWRARLYGQGMSGVGSEADPTAAVRRLFDAKPGREPIDSMLYADSFIRLPDHPVMITDRMTMAHSLEARSPFMDHELAEFTARLPVALKVRGRSLRWIQKRLAERYLPPDVLARPKQGFASALPYMLRDEYEQLFDVFLARSALAEDEVLRQPAIDQLLGEHRAGRADHGNRLWLLVNSEVWYRMYIRGQSTAQLRETCGAPQGRPATRAA